MKGIIIPADIIVIKRIIINCEFPVLLSSEALSKCDRIYHNKENLLNENILANPVTCLHSFTDRKVFDNATLPRWIGASRFATQTDSVCFIDRWKLNA